MKHAPRRGLRCLPADRWGMTSGMKGVRWRIVITSRSSLPSDCAPPSRGRPEFERMLQEPSRAAELMRRALTPTIHESRPGKSRLSHASRMPTGAPVDQCRTCPPPDTMLARYGHRLMRIAQREADVDMADRLSGGVGGNLL